jgi:hypothetical protein
MQHVEIPSLQLKLRGVSAATAQDALALLPTILEQCLADEPPRFRAAAGDVLRLPRADDAQGLAEQLAEQIVQRLPSHRRFL